MIAVLHTFNSALARTVESALRYARGLLGGGDASAMPARVYWDESVALTLSNLVQEIETRASGRVQVISLADFRDAVGELWEKYNSRILLIAESTISRMIGKGNTFISQGEDAWLLLFPGLTEDKAQGRADAIAARIGAKLVGAQFTAQELPLPEAARLDLSGALNADGSINLESVKQAISRVRKSQIKAVVAVTPAKIAPRAAAPAPSDAARAKTFFQPAWCAETQSIDLFCFRALTELGAPLYAEGAPAATDATIIDLTRAATEHFAGMCEAKLQAKMAIPIPYSPLVGGAAAEIVRLIAAQPQRERLLHLRVEIVQIPQSATADRLVAIRELFRPYVREVALMVDLFSPSEQVLALDHIMLGADARNTAGYGDEQLFQDMLLFRQRAGRRGTYVLGLQQRGHIKCAVNAGIAEIGGPGLTENIKRLPQRVSVIRREDLSTP
jgi:hypothetical protein